MTSDLRSMGPHLPAGKVNLPTAIEHIGPLICPDWDGTERKAAELAGERKAALAEVANFDDERFASAERVRQQEILDEAQRQRESPPILVAMSDSVCATCGKPAARTRAGQTYCDRHGKRQDIPPEIRKRLFAKKTDAAALASRPAATRDPAGSTRHWLVDKIENRFAPDLAALRRWELVHEALFGALIAGQLMLTELSQPGAGRCLPTIDEWRAHFPAPNEARARIPRCAGDIPLHVIFSLVELDRAFSHNVPTVPADLPTKPPGRPSVMYLVQQEMDRRAERDELLPGMNAESEYLATWIRSHCGDTPPPRPTTIRKELAAHFRDLKAKREPQQSGAGN